MNWICISGSWRTINEQVIKDVRAAVKKIILAGDGIISGGALGVDFIALDEALFHNPTAEQIKIFLPTTLKIYRQHYFHQSKKGIISQSLAQAIAKQLQQLKKINAKSLLENKAVEEVNQKTYYQRIDQEIAAADELKAFQVNKSKGTQYTIDQARKKGLPIEIFAYIISKRLSEGY